jgi:hypothetical protein
LNTEQLGLRVIGESGVPVSASFQGIDHEVFPWLKGTLLQHPSIECLSATYGHGLIPLMHPAQQKWEIEHGPNTNRVTFFPEFYTPQARIIPDMFFVLGQHTVTYTVRHPPHRAKQSEKFLLAVDPEDSATIRYGSKIGLVMRGFGALLSKFFAFQLSPYASGGERCSPLSQLLKEIERIATEVSGIVIMPLDIEAPYIGSLEGEKVWEILFRNLKQTGLDSTFISLTDVVADASCIDANQTHHPHRELGPKWFGYQTQFDYYSFIRNFKPGSKREHLLLSLAGTSDALSALYRKIIWVKEHKRLLLEAIDLAGCKRRLPVGGADSHHVFSLCQSALLALKTHAPLTSIIHKHCDISVPLVKQTLTWAEAHCL